MALHHEVSSAVTCCCGNLNHLHGPNVGESPLSTGCLSPWAPVQSVLGSPPRWTYLELLQEELRHPNEMPNHLIFNGSAFYSHSLSALTGSSVARVSNYPHVCFLAAHFS